MQLNLKQQSQEDSETSRGHSWGHRYYSMSAPEKREISVFVGGKCKRHITKIDSL